MSESRSAHDLFAEYLSSLEEGAHVDFEAWVAEHPAKAGELRALFASDPTLPGSRARGPASPAPGEGASTSTPFFHSPSGGRATSDIRGAVSVGDVVGEFRLLALLGSGGMGQVWEALQLPLNRRVALKLVRPGCVSPQVLQMFAREARAGGRLSHPAIVAVHGFGESEGVHWIAMELVAGGWTLREFIDRMRKLEELPRDYYAQVAALVAELADALQTAHDAHVIHRDIKPQNVLITPEDRPKVTDFGLARITDETALSRTGEFAGTYLYMSPEQVAASRMGIDTRTDVFSLGVVLYELLGLVRPFEGDTTHQIAEKILTHDPPDLRAVRSRVPLDLAVIAGKTLEKRRDDRYQSMAELALDLRRYLANEPVHARPPGALRRAHKWIERHPTVSVAASLLVLGLIGTASTTVWALDNAAQAREEQGRVFRLTASDELAVLVDEARSEALWPAEPARIARYDDWLRRADEVLAGLHPNPLTGDPGHLAQLAEIRARGEPVAASVKELTGAEAVQLARLRGALAAARRAQAVREGQAQVEEPSIENETTSTDAADLSRAGWELVAPERVEFGREAMGLALARAALDHGLVEGGRPALLAFETYCEASLANGLEEQALAELETIQASFDPSVAADFALFVADFVPRAEAAGERAPAEILSLEQRIEALAAGSAAPAFTFTDERDRWWHDHLQQLVEDLEAFADPSRGPIRGSTADFGWGIERRKQWAQTVESSSLTNDEANALWAAAIESIADVHACPQYEGLRIAPQLGLLPIGRDPDSSLWEFAHLQSGQAAQRDADGRIVRDPGMGIVLVLVPGAERARGHVPPFFLSKFELTQAQWERCTCANSSFYSPHGPNRPGITSLNPVENVSWLACTRFAQQFGLELPSEAQWSRAALWDEGPWAEVIARPPEPRSTANLLQATPGASIGFAAEDTYDVHAPVGSFPANPLGFHDIRGNVCEWSAESEGTVGAAGASAERAAGLERVYLGGGWNSWPSKQEYYRLTAAPYDELPDRGLRPARALRE